MNLFYIMEGLINKLYRHTDWEMTSMITEKDFI